MINMTFNGDYDTKEQILSFFDMHIDNDRYIIHNENNERAISRDGKILHVDEWIGLYKDVNAHELVLIRGSDNDRVRITKKGKKTYT